MYLLSIDTSSAWLCAVVSDNERVLASYCRERGRGHGKYLLSVIARLLDRCGIAPEDLHGLAAVNGPGSFTGLRIGLATIKGLATARCVPVALVASLDVLAAGAARDNDVVVPMIDARRQQVYAAVYRNNAGRQLTRRGSFFLGPPAEILRRVPGTAVILGDAARLLSAEIRQYVPQAQVLPDSFSRPRPRVLAELAYRAHAAGRVVAAAAVSARYMYRDTCAVRRVPPQQDRT